MAEEAELEEVDVNEKDLYKIFGVSRGAKADELKKAYRQKSLKYHPDKNPSPDAKLKFQRIAEAYSVLSDDKKRLKYDKSGDMDLEDFDMDQFLNMWVGEMMEDGGIVDDMMQSVLPWSDDHEKMQQFMDENIVSKGGKLQCQICGHTGSNKRLMMIHFERKHLHDCEEWAKETIKSMKNSFESFMKQVTGIGDPSGEFLLPDGTKADVSKVPVPDIRAHMQKRVDKAKVLDEVLETYRVVAGSELSGNDGPVAAEEQSEVKRPTALPEPKKLSDILGVPLEEAKALSQDKPRLLRRLQKRIEELNEEEDEAEDLLQPMGGFTEGMGFGLDGLDGLEDLLGASGMPPALQRLLGEDAEFELEAFKDVLGSPGSFPPHFLQGGLDPGRLEDFSDMQRLLGGPQGRPQGGPGRPGFAELQALGGFGPGGLSGDVHRSPASGGRVPVARAARPGVDDDSEPEIGCICGYTCGTEKALARHLDRFPGDRLHARK